MATKFVVATGYDLSFDDSRIYSEVLDLSNNAFACKNKSPFAMKTEGATGALVKGKHLICGGKNSDFYYGECYRLTKVSTIFVMEMKSERAYASSAIVDFVKLWVIGGRSCKSDSCILITSEYVQIGKGSNSGPVLPVKMYGHVITAMNSTTYIVTGGGQDSLRKTFYYSENSQDWITGPEMNQERRQHGAGLGTDTATSELYIAVTGGVLNSGHYSGAMDSVEILFLGDTEWKTGKQHLFHNMGKAIGTFLKYFRTEYAK